MDRGRGDVTPFKIELEAPDHEEQSVPLVIVPDDGSKPFRLTIPMDWILEIANFVEEATPSNHDPQDDH